MRKRTFYASLSLLFLTISICCKGQELEKVYNRNIILNYLKGKVENNDPLVVHVLVPLCDNEHQGIVPTSPKIGNGMDIKNNLYWATSKGMKRFFSNAADWEFVHVKHFPKTVILERAVFYKEFPNGARVYLVADAYRGDKMPACLNDYFNSLSSHLIDTIRVQKEMIGINGGADLIAFNGHNGLMDESTVYKHANVQTRPKDAVSISCASNGYFKSHYLNTKSYPLVHTTNLLYPGAFVLKYIIDEWALLKPDKDCKIAAGNAYYTFKPKSGPNGSQNLFDYGWQYE